jgi:hypothetical protein
MHFACDQVDCWAWGGVNPSVPTKCHVHNLCSYDVALNQYISQCGGASNLKYTLFSELQHVQCLINECLCQVWGIPYTLSPKQGTWVWISNEEAVPKSTWGASAYLPNRTPVEIVPSVCGRIINNSTSTERVFVKSDVAQRKRRIVGPFQFTSRMDSFNDHLRVWTYEPSYPCSAHA